MMMTIGNQGRSTRSVTKNVPATMAFVAVASVATVHSNATDGDEGEFASAAAEKVVHCPGNRSDAPATDPMP